MTLPYLDAGALERLLPPRVAREAIHRAFAEGATTTPARQHLGTQHGDLLVMPAWDRAAAGVKLVTVAPGNPAAGLPLIHGVYVLFDAETLQPVALLDGAALTAIRTPAVSAFVAAALAAPGATSLVVFGAGVQAHMHVLALADVRNLQDIKIVTPSDSSERLARRLSEAGLPASSGSPEDAMQADIVCTCTTSPTTVLTSEMIAAETLVIAVGAYKPNARELPSDLLARATIVVEDREHALHEAGDLILAIEEGAIDRDDVTVGLSDLANGKYERRGNADVIVFKSVGMALEDLAVAQAAHQRWQESR